MMEWPRTLEEYEGRVLYALRSFQIIEMVLKAYLCCAPANTSSPEQSQASSLEDVQYLDLKKLISRFKKSNSNTELHALLEKCVRDRNRVAHQALITQNSGIAKIIGATALDIKKIREIDRQASNIMGKLVVEFIKTGRHGAA